MANAGEKALNNESSTDGNVQRVSTRQWAQENDYDSPKLFNKFFQDDIKYLLSMGKLFLFECVIKNVLGLIVRHLKFCLQDHFLTL